MKLFNSMSRKKEEFVPITPGEVKMYCCGPTVCNYIHVGNARPMILFDVLRRYLEYRGYKVTFVQNFTDVDDKIIKRANEEHATSQEISEKYIEEYFKDAHGLGVRDATVHPKATENIQQIIDLVQTLIDKGYAYPVNGDVYYRTKKFEGYGKLSHQPIEARAVPAGTSSAPPCPTATWARPSTSTAAARICSSPTTRTRSPSLRLPTDVPSSTTGCTTAS